VAADAKVLLQGRIDPEASAAGHDPYLQEHLLSTTVRQEARLANPDQTVRPLVFLNACQVGRLGHQLSSLGGFADSFIKAGAGAFISSLWNVGDQPAATFGMTFYARLKAGDTVAVASVAVREAAREARDASWLAYVVYAHPDARLT
jgi:CHAT domain-containing protein